VLKKEAAMSTETIASFITTTHFDKLPPNVVKQVKVAIRDNLGLLLATAKDETAVPAREFALALGGREESTLLGSDVKVSCPVASMVNTIIAKGLGGLEDGEYRDVGFLCHCGGTILATALAVAERQNATGKNLIEAVVMGYEVAMRAGWISRLGGKMDMVETYAATAVAAKLLGLTAEETTNALGLAEARNFSVFSIRGRPREKIPSGRVTVGWGAMIGVTAALLAQSGFSGPYTVFDLAEHNQEPLKNLGKDWEIMRQFFKLNNNCRFCDAPIDGVLQLTKRHNLGADDISQITLGVAEQATTMVGNTSPTTAFEAIFSLPFVIGAILIDGEMGPDQTSAEKLRDERILNQVRKVKLVADPEAEALRPGKAAARVKIETKDGKKFETFVIDPRGAFENPLSEEELIGKFRKLATRTIDASKTEELIKRLDRLEELSSVSDLISMMA